MSNEVKRINVAVNQETVDALSLLVEREGVTLTEAVRRVVGYGAFLYQHVKVQGGTVLLVDGDTTREAILL